MADLQLVFKPFFRFKKGGLSHSNEQPSQPSYDKPEKKESQQCTKNLPEDNHDEFISHSLEEDEIFLNEIRDIENDHHHIENMEEKDATNINDQLYHHHHHWVGSNKSQDVFEENPELNKLIKHAYSLYEQSQEKISQVRKSFLDIDYTFMELEALMTKNSILSTATKNKMHNTKLELMMEFGHFLSVNDKENTFIHV